MTLIISSNALLIALLTLVISIVVAFTQKK
ncbi:hypothetical protein [Paenibacillus turicensis]|nr:hypothetical protein [Paenibacillus turicensis]